VKDKKESRAGLERAISRGWSQVKDGRVGFSLVHIEKMWDFYSPLTQHQG